MLIDAAADLDMQMTLPKNTLTLQALTTSNYMWLDNVFISTSLTNALTCCCTLPEEQPARTDPIPIITELDIGVDTQTTLLHPNFRRSNWKEVGEKLMPRLKWLESGEGIQSASELFTCVGRLMHTIKDVIDPAIPKSNLPPHQK